jgi:hypothetical protein
MRTSFHHQPEAQHPKFPAIHKRAGRLPHLTLQLPAAAASRRNDLTCQIANQGTDRDGHLRHQRLVGGHSFVS